MKDRVSISEKARRLQKLIDDELKRRESGIPREHWKWAGIEKEPYQKPELHLVDADYEIYEPIQEKRPQEKPKTTWDFYFFLFSVLSAGMLASWLVVDWCIKAFRGLMQ